MTVSTRNCWLNQTVLAASLATAGAAYGGGVLHVDDDTPPDLLVLNLFPYLKRGSP